MRLELDNDGTRAAMQGKNKPALKVTHPHSAEDSTLHVNLPSDVGSMWGFSPWRLTHTHTMQCSSQQYSQQKDVLNYNLENEANTRADHFWPNLAKVASNCICLSFYTGIIVLYLSYLDQVDSYRDKTNDPSPPTRHHFKILLYCDFFFFYTFLLFHHCTPGSLGAFSLRT